MEVSVLPLLLGAGETQAERIAHFRLPLIPNVRFEWHPKSKRLYLIRLGQELEIGEPIAYDVHDHGLAWNYVLVWSRGYREAQNPPRTQEEVEKRLKGAGEIP
jgi:hypothetical protein